MLPSYVIQSEATTNPPGNDQWVVYSIKIGSGIYIGFTGDLRKRIAEHLIQINKIVNGIRLPLRFTNRYKKFSRTNIVKHGIEFKIESFHNDGVIARTAERRQMIEAAETHTILNLTIPKPKKQESIICQLPPLYVMGIDIRSAAI